MFRPWSALALLALAMSFLLFTGIWSQAPSLRSPDNTARPPPTLSLIAAGDYQQAVHFAFDTTSEEPGRHTTFVAPRYAMRVSPQDWVKIYTHSPLGLPRIASARFYASARPEPCFGNVMIGCVKLDTGRRGALIPLHPGTADDFGFVAPAAPGNYWVALQADWGFGTTTQVFVIDVRA